MFEEQELAFTDREFQVFCLLFMHPHRVYSKEQIYRIVTQNEKDSYHTVEITISRIRHKLRQHRITAYPPRRRLRIRASDVESFLFSLRRQPQLDCQAGPVNQNQICQCKHDIQFGGMLSQTPVSCFSVSQQTFHDPEYVFHLSADR